MSHEIQSAVFSAAEGAGWTGLGKAIPADIAKDPRKIAELVGATYNVLAMPLTYSFAGQQVTADNRVAQIRSDTGELLEVTSGNRYHTCNRQPVDVFEAFRDELAKENLTISHAAVLAGGAKIAVCARFGDSVMKTDDAGRDIALPYVTGATGYDGKTGTNYFMTAIRTVCANTLRMGMDSAQHTGKLIHFKASQKLEAGALKDMLADAMAIVQNETAYYQRLTQIKMRDPDARKYFARILGIDTDLMDAGARNVDGRKVVSTRATNSLDGLMRAYKTGPGAELPTANGTLFGALNAVTYVTDHESSIRDTRKDGTRVARLTSATFGNGAQVKATAVREANSILSGLLERPVLLRDRTDGSEFARLLKLA